MTDREMLLMAYGAMKAVVDENGNIAEVVALMESHLYPPEIISDEITMNGRPSPLPISGQGV